MINEVIEIIGTDIHDDSYETGIHAYFKSINDKWGLKFYHHERMRDKTYDLQALAHSHGLAPALGEKFNINIPNIGPIYGYVTEKIIVTLEDTGNYPGEGQEDMRMQYDDFDRFIYKLESIMFVSDMENFNVGFLEDGKMVAIDFSECHSFDNLHDGW